MKQAMIEKLTKMGANRWTKGANDRLYIKDAAAQLIGFEFDSYKSSGMISSAKVGGSKISNTQAAKLAAALKTAYIDLNTDCLVMAQTGYTVDVQDAIEAMTAEFDAEEAAAETAEEAAEAGGDRGELASNYMPEYNDTDIRVIRYEHNAEKAIAMIETSDGKFWFADNAEHYQVSRWIDPSDINWDDERAWVEGGEIDEDAVECGHSRVIGGCEVA